MCNVRSLSLLSLSLLSSSFFPFLLKVSHLDEVAMGSEERQELEAKIDDLEERVDEYEKTQKDIFLTICQVRTFVNLFH